MRMFPPGNVACSELRECKRLSVCLLEDRSSSHPWTSSCCADGRDFIGTATGVCNSIAHGMHGPWCILIPSCVACTVPGALIPLRATCSRTLSGPVRVQTPGEPEPDPKSGSIGVRFGVCKNVRTGPKVRFEVRRNVP